MSQPVDIPPPSRSWKEIRQAVSPRAMSREGRKRARLSAFRIVLLGVFVAGCAWGSLEVYQNWDVNPRLLKTPVKNVPLREVEFVTDGTLDRAWLHASLALPRNASLTELDLPKLLARLLASGQVKSAMLTPKVSRNTLLVTVLERTPVARLKISTGDQLLVARDGVVYAGIGYGPAEIEGLPWLDGMTLKRAAAGYEPIPDMERVAGLLSVARTFIPDLYAGWEVVSLARLPSDREIIVRSHEVARITFDAQVDFVRQVAELSHIVGTMERAPGTGLASVNFAAGGQVAVQLADAAPAKNPPLPTFSSRYFQPRL